MATGSLAPLNASIYWHTKGDWWPPGVHFSLLFAGLFATFLCNRIRRVWLLEVQQSDSGTHYLGRQDFDHQDANRTFWLDTLLVQLS